MSTQKNLEALSELKLHGMHRAYRTIKESATEHTNDELLAHLIEAEKEDRNDRRLQRLLQNAKFRYHALPEELDLKTERNLNKDQITELLEGHFIDKGEHVVITGATGGGKSFIASAIGHKACRLGKRVLYQSCRKLFSSLSIAHAEGNYQKQLKRIAKQDLLILDDLGLHPIGDQERLMLMDLIEDRHGLKSTIIVSQVPVDQWYELLQESTLADAIMDRIVHTAHRIEIKGESMRKKKTEKEQ